MKAFGHLQRWGGDRRNDPANSLMDVWGRWGAIASNGTVTWSGQIFRITTESFPPVYPGTLPANRDPGHYDPVWPPDDVNLGWWYHTTDTGWPTDPPPLEFLKADIYSRWTTEHNGACATTENAFLVWADHRGRSPRSAYFPNRNQHDVRLARISWP